jgi:hypothetical protein
MLAGCVGEGGGGCDALVDVDVDGNGDAFVEDVLGGEVMEAPVEEALPVLHNCIRAPTRALAVKGNPQDISTRPYPS